MSGKQAYVYFCASYCGKSHQIHDLDIFQLKIRIPDKNILFATLLKLRLRAELALMSFSTAELKKYIRRIFNQKTGEGTPFNEDDLFPNGLKHKRGKKQQNFSDP